MPYDLWTEQRSYPYGFDEQLYATRMAEVRTDAAEAANRRDVILSNPWISEGPGNIGGRFNCLEKDPTDDNIIYAGASNGGIFKTTDGGASWTPIFDDMAYMAIGEIRVDPVDPDKIWVATGDRNFGGGSHIGNGVYMSADGGSTWTHMGLENTGIVTELHIDPTNTDRIFAGTLGNTYEKTMDRGVYRTTDGGTTWTNVLIVSDSSGVCDMVMDPTNPDILYACFYNRINLPFSPRVTGPDSKIYKTTDGGDTWTQLGGGLPTGDNSRVGIDIVPSTPNTLYAIYIDWADLNPVDVFKTTDGGTSWTPLDIYAGATGMETNVMGGFGWYFGQIHVNPFDEDQLTVQGVEQWVSLNGGADWDQNVPDWWTYEVHADKHDILYFSANEYIIATDGGLYKTTNGGISWTDIENIPVTQFYHVDVDPINEGMYGGGAQDNGTMDGNLGVYNAWNRLFGGDGFRLTWKKDAPGEAYYETQTGGLYYFDGFSTSTVSPTVSDPDRVNWDMPYLVNETDAEAFCGTSKMWIMESEPFGTWVDISGDLTKVETGSYIGNPSKHTISEVEQDKFDSGVLYAGTTDGKVWRGNGSGMSWSWTDVTGTNPDRYVTALRASSNAEGSIYVGYSGYTLNDYSSYLYKSEDYGDTWTDISGDLPDMPVNDIMIIPGNEDYLFAALDGGVYFSGNAGVNWSYVGTDMPNVTVSELDVDIPNAKLIAGTYSRSMYSYDISWIDNLGEPPFGFGLNEASQDEFISYPNPVTDLLYFQNLDAENVQILDLQGREVLSKKVVDFGNYQQVNLSALPSGTYIVLAGEKRKKIVVK